MATIWRTTDRMGREVELTDTGWAHILAERGEASPSAAEVRAAVEAPDFVNADAVYAHRENHYRRFGAGGRYLKVVVQYRPVPPQGTWAGDVVTTYPTNRVKRKERRLWL